MATSFPTGLDALTNPVSTDTLASPSHADQHANVNDAVEALEAKVGVNGSAVTSSLDYRVRNIDATTAIVSGSSSGDLVRITQTGTGNALVVEDSANPDSTPFVVNSAGLVGIGVTTCLTNLHVLAGTATGITPGAGGRIFLDGSNANNWIDIATSTTGVGGLRFGDSDAMMRGRLGYSNNLDSFDFYTAGTERMRIDSVGNVGIGTTTPSSYGLLSVGASIGASSTTNMIAMYQSAGVDSATMRIAGYAYTGNARTAIDFVQNGASNFQSQMVFSTSAGANAIERMRITSAGLVGIGVTPTSMLHVVNTTAANKAFIVKGAASQSGSLFDIQNSAGTSLVVVNSAGNLVIGSGTAVASISGVTSSNQILGSSAATSSMLLSRYSADANGPTIHFGKSRNATVGSHTANTSGDRLGNINFNGSDGTNFVGASSISADSEGTISTGVVPGRLLFFTANSAGTLTERMRITSAGDVGIGVTPTSKLHVVGSFSRGAPVTKTASFTLADTENWIICNGTASITVTLPAASTQVGREISLKNTAAFTVVSASSNIVPLAGGAAGTAILPATAGTWATLVSDGTNWVIMQS
jgi:hypothetical protein